MRSILTLLVKNRVFANLLLAFLIVAGVVSTKEMVREMFPSFSLDVILVRVPYPGAGPEEVEEGISLKIEDAIEGLSGIKRYTTRSAEGMSLTIIEVKEGEDVQLVKDRVSDQVNAILTFPDDAEKPTIEAIESQRDTLVVSLVGDLPEEQLKELAENLKDEIIRLPSVSKVGIHGTRDYEISIELSEETLRRYGLTLAQVGEIVRNSSFNLPGGDLRSQEELIKIRTMGRNYTGKEYGDIVLISAPNGASVRLRDVATIRDSFIEDEVYTRFNEKPAVSLTIYNREDEDAIHIAGEIESFVEQKNAEFRAMGLEDVSLHTWLDASTFIVDRIDLLVRNGIIGLVLVFCLLSFFLDLRLAFWVSLGIPVSFAGALLLMWGLGATLNMISLFALIMVLGIVVDDAIVVGEAIYYHRSQGDSPLQAAINGTMEVIMPVFASVTTTCVAFIPLFFVKGIMGKFIAVIPMVVICALLVSLIESFFILPAHLNNLPEMRAGQRPTGWLARRTYPFRSRLANFLENMVNKYYRAFLREILSWRYVSLAALFAILFFTMGLMQGGFIKFLFFPDIDTAFMMATVEFPDGTPTNVTRDAVYKLEDGLRKVDEEYRERTGRDLIVAMESNIGLRRGLDSVGGTGQGVGSHLGEIRVEIIDPEVRHYYFREIIQKWRDNVGAIPGALSLAIEGMSGGPPGKPIEVWLLGRDLDQMTAASEELKTKLATYDGVFQIEDDFRPGKRELRLRLKPEARNLGLTLNTLAQQVRRGFYGDEVVRVQRGREEVKVWVRYPQEERESILDFSQVRIRTPLGEEIPLHAVANVDLQTGYTTIVRKDGRRRIAVSADVFTQLNNPGEITRDLERNFLPVMASAYPGVEFAIEGQNRETADSFSSLKLGFPLAILGIFLIIATVFRSYIQPIVIMITVPFGIIGAVWGHILLGYDLTMMSLFGVVALAGVVVNTAIVLIEAINSRIARGMVFADAVVDGSVRRFRAIILTSATTIGGLTPLIMETSMQAQFLIPMALTLAAGVAFSTVLTLAVVPCLLYILNDARRGIFRLVKGYWPTCEEVEPASQRHFQEDELAGLPQVPEDRLPTPAG